MISAFVKGVQQLGDKETQKPLWISIGVAIGVFALLWTGFGVLITHTTLFQWGWLDTLADGLGWALVLVLTWVMFPGVVSAMVALFLEQIAETVEHRHYPGLPKAEGQPVGEQIMTALRFLGVMVLLNILLLPFMLFGPVYPLLFYCVNGYLLGREYFELVASRRLGQREVILLRRTYGGRIFLAGTALAMLLTVPVVNLLAPVIATAAMVHLFETWRRAGGGPKTTAAGAQGSALRPKTTLDGNEPEA